MMIRKTDERKIDKDSVGDARIRCRSTNAQGETLTERRT
jgi:hypothetical protein